MALIRSALDLCHASLAAAHRSGLVPVEWELTERFQRVLTRELGVASLHSTGRIGYLLGLRVKGSLSLYPGEPSYATSALACRWSTSTRAVSNYLFLVSDWVLDP